MEKNNWEQIATYGPGYSVWLRITPIYKVASEQPGAQDGGYFSISEAIRVKGFDDQQQEAK